MIELTWQKFGIFYNVHGQKVDGLGNLKHLEGRYVYVIETPTGLAIGYPNGVSNVCYVGRQANRGSPQSTRSYAHARGWISKFLILTQSSGPFTIHVCHPRRRNMVKAYQDVEAYLIRSFEEKFGHPPLFNGRREKELGDYAINMNASIFRRRQSCIKPAFNVGGPMDGDVLED